MKTRLGIVFGGKSGEHDVSIMSAKSIVENVDTAKFLIKLYGISREGLPYKFDKTAFLCDKSTMFQKAKELTWGEFVDCIIKEVDVVFPILHGPFGEDGRIQGMFDMIGVKYVGPHLTSSAICMDKGYNKDLLKMHSFNVLPYTTINRWKYQKQEEKQLEKAFELMDYPIFVKPANLGSSVGISKANDKIELKKAISLAFDYDDVIILEQGIDARELECGVIGNYKLDATVLGEIVPSHDFYDYDAKYSEEALSDIIIPANIAEEEMQEIRKEAARACEMLGVKGLSRVDFLKDKNTGEVFLSEVNTIPGFTKYSMYPLLAERIGYSYSNLISKLVELALE